MITIYKSKDYRISSQGISLIENALGRPDLVQVSVSSDCVIIVAPQKAYGITLQKNGEYMSWKLRGVNTKLARAESHHIYARLDRNSTDALLLFSVNDYDIDGKIKGSGEPNKDYFYIKIGSITHTDSVVTPTLGREITIDFGFLTTPGAETDNSGWKELFELTADGLIRPLKRFTSYVVKGTLSIIGKIVLNNKQISDIARQGDPEPFVESDEVVPTTKLLKGKYLEELRKVFLNKDRKDQTEYLLKLLGGVEVGEFIDSMIAGKGAGIFADGRAQVESLEVRSYLKVMELIYNRLSALEGDYVMTESGTIEQLEDLGEKTYRLHIRKRWENDFTALEKDDILRASINNLDKAGEYYVAFYRVLSKNNVENTLTVVMYSDEECPSGHNYPPAKGMTMHRWGNTSDKKRQNCWYISSTEGRIVYLTGVTSPKLSQDMYASFYGLPVNLDIFANKPINYDEPYLYVRGLLAQDIIHVDHQGRLVYEIVDRGAWSEEVANSDDPYLFETKRESTGLMETHDVWLNSCRYRCLKTGTRLRPKWNSPDWVEISGDPKIWMDFEQPNGTEFAHAIDCPIHVHIYKGTEEITDDVLDADIEWTRDTGNPDADIAWAAQHSSSKKFIHITDDDCPPDVWLVKFTCKAFVRDGKGKIEPVENYYFVE